jgi:hypothetical protein
MQMNNIMFSLRSKLTMAARSIKQARAMNNALIYCNTEALLE